MTLRKALLDTDTLSELFKDVNENVRTNAARYLIEHPRLTYTSLSSLEILSGLERKGATAKIKRAQKGSRP